MKAIVNGIEYRIERAGYGNWIITREDGKKVHTTDSLLIDWINDDNDELQAADAIRKLEGLFYEEDTP